MNNIILDGDKLETYRMWAKTIHQNIMDSFAYYGYLQGLDDFFQSYQSKNKLSIACVEFIKRQKYLLQTAICLNIAKLLFDKGTDVYSFDNYKHIIEGYKGERLNIKKPKLDKNLAETIIGFRKNYMAHSIAYADAISVKISDLFEVLKLEVAYFNAITEDVVFEQCYRFNDDAVEKWIHHCKTGVWDFILMNSNT